MCMAFCKYYIQDKMNRSVNQRPSLSASVLRDVQHVINKLGLRSCPMPH